MRALDQHYLESICEDIEYYIEERCALDGINVSDIHPIKVYVSKNNKEFIGTNNGKRIFKTKARISVDICSIERKEY